MRERTPIKYTIVDDFDHIIDERNNETINLRKLYWGDKEENVKLDLRRWVIDDDGKEIVGKGVSFFTDSAPHTLTNTLTKYGYGSTYVILNNIKDRPDFQSSLNRVLGKDKDRHEEPASDNSGAAFYDPRESLFR